MTRARRATVALALRLAPLAGRATATGPLASPPAPPSKAPSPTPDPAGGWQAIADGPLSGRTDAAALWTGSEVLVFGGDADGYCPPELACDRKRDHTTALRDGAAYDPVADTWRP